MADLLVLAFQIDLTRIATFVFANDGSNRSYRADRRPRRPPRPLAPWRRYAQAAAKCQKINRFHMTQLAYLLEKLKAIPDGTGNLLDHCLIALRQRHQRWQLCTRTTTCLIVLAGKARPEPSERLAGTSEPAGETPLFRRNFTYRCLIDRDQVSRLGDSTGRLATLEGSAATSS